MIHNNTETVLSGGGLAPLTDPDPYPDSTPTKYLTRTVLSNTVSLTSLSTTLYNPTTTVFTDNFLTLINTFTYFSFKAIEVRIEFNYPPTSGGFIMLNFFPWNRPTAAMFRTGLTGPGTTMEPIIVTAGMSQVIVRTLPWLYPKNKVLTANIGEIYPMWNVRAAVSLLLKNNSLAPTPTVNMIIWTRLIEPKLSIPWADASAVSLQSGLADDATNGILMGTVVTVGTLAWNSFVGAAYKEVGSIASEYGKQAVDSGLNMVKHSIEQSSVKHREMVTVKEGGPVRQDFRVNPWGDTSSCNQLANRNPVVMDPTATVRAVAQYPGPGDWRVKDLIMRPTSILYYALTTNGQFLSIPQLCGPLYYQVIPGYSIYYERWVDYFSQFFRYWRGGFKWRFMFVLPPFQNCRVMIIVQTRSVRSPSYVDTILSREITVEGVVFEEFTVPFMCEAPWRSCCAGDGLTGPNEEPGNNSYSTPWITVNLITPIFTEGDVAPALVVQAWSAAAEDFEFDGFSPQIPLNLSVEAPKKITSGVKLQSQPLLEFERPFEGIYGRSLAEHLPGFDMTCRDIASRYSPRAITPGSYGSMSEGIAPGLFGQDITIGNQSCYDAIISLFLFFSGPIVVKMNISEFTSPAGWFSPYPSNLVSGATYSTPVWLGTAMFDKTFFPTTEFESPFISPFDYVFVNNADLPDGYLTGIDNADPFFQFTSGQNFIEPLVAATSQSNFFVPMCPPVVDYWFSGLSEVITFVQPTLAVKRDAKARRKVR